MKAIMVVGLPPRDGVAERLFRAGFFVLPADDATDAAAILSAIRPDGFVIHVGDERLGGERLVERLQNSEALGRLPIVVTGARPGQDERFARRGPAVEAIPACEHGADAVLEAMRRLMASAEADRVDADDVPGRNAWRDARVDVGVPARTLRRWIADDAARRTDARS